MKRSIRMPAPACEFNSNRLWKNSTDANNMDGMVSRVLMQNNFRMLKKAVRQGRSERRGEAYAAVR